MNTEKDHKHEHVCVQQKQMHVIQIQDHKTR